jgi:hypothetical protein
MQPHIQLLFILEPSSPTRQLNDPRYIYNQNTIHRNARKNMHRDTITISHICMESHTFMAPNPAKWNVLSVICVDGSPTDWAASSPTASPGWQSASCGQQSPWFRTRKTLRHCDTNKHERYSNTVDTFTH